ncbi:hypothetical protein KUL49_18330 [Alteromonas sp. KUL49]|nr:hypothetical protein KUL49_18330 [Alteromonas sp. KUL49]
MTEMAYLDTTELNGKPDTTGDKHENKNLAVAPKHIIDGRYNVVDHRNSLVVLFIVALNSG